jgi:plasmid stabilization system protein ParE
VTPRRLEYAPRYFRRLGDIRERIAADNPTAADRMIERIRAAVTHLAASPALGRSGRVAGTRELVIPHTPYLSPIGSKVTSFRLSRYCTAPSDGLTACPEWRDRTALSACTIDSPHKILSAGGLIAEALLELDQGARKIGHRGHQGQFCS